MNPPPSSTPALSTSTTAPIKVTVDLPFSPEDIASGKLSGKKNLYTLFFRAGNNPHAMSKHFFLSGDLRDVVIRAKKHCDTLGYRFVRIEPFISDLAADERKHTGGSDENAN